MNLYKCAHRTIYPKIWAYTRQTPTTTANVIQNTRVHTYICISIFCQTIWKSNHAEFHNAIVKSFSKISSNHILETESFPMLIRSSFRFESTLNADSVLYTREFNYRFSRSSIKHKLLTIFAFNACVS